MGIKQDLNGSLNPVLLIRCMKNKRAFRKVHPDYFDPSGTLVFTGSQGEGKTLSAVSYIINVAREYPKSILVSNTYIDPVLLPPGYDVREYTGLDDLKNINNGYAGVMYFIDEIHLELNSLESKNIDIDIMTEISQQRKQRKHIIGTSQRYNRMAKPLREQVRNIVVCRCFFGLLQFNKLIDAFNTTEHNGELKLDVRKRFFWFHDPVLYNAYDTFAKMKRYSQEWQGSPKVDYWALHGSGEVK